MARAEIYLEDVIDGIGVGMKFVFLGGYQPKSDAHQMCQVIQHLLDELAAKGDITRLGEAESVVVDDA